MRVTGIILAGGESTRMGVDKGLVAFKGKPMIAWVLDAVAPLVDELFIVTSNQAYGQFGYPLVQDEVKGKGPLMGIYSGLKKSKTSRNLVLSCDVPYVNSEFLMKLLEVAKGYEVTIPEHDSLTHQLFAVIDKSCESIFEQGIRADELKLLKAYQRTNLHVWNASDYDERIFINVNSQDELEA